MSKSRLMDFEVFRGKCEKGDQLQLAASFALKINLLKVKGLERSCTQSAG